MPVDLTVMTQNVYIGADGDPVLASPSPETVAAALDSIAANNFPARAGAIATEAAGAGGPLLIGLQEADIIGGPTGTLNYTQILLDQLAARGLHYVIAGAHTGFNVAVNGLSLTDRDVVLARTDVAGFTISGSESHTFLNNASLTTPLGTLPLDRGYVLVNATLDGIPFQFVSTHLETDKSIGAAQANELLSALGTATELQLVVGDFNALPTDMTHAEMVAAGFIDVDSAVGAVGATCCQAADLNNPVSQLSGRNRLRVRARFLVHRFGVSRRRHAVRGCAAPMAVRSRRGDCHSRRAGAIGGSAFCRGDTPARRHEIASSQPRSLRLGVSR